MPSFTFFVEPALSSSEDSPQIEELSNPRKESSWQEWWAQSEDLWSVVVVLSRLTSFQGYRVLSLDGRVDVAWRSYMTQISPDPEKNGWWTDQYPLSSTNVICSSTQRQKRPTKISPLVWCFVPSLLDYFMRAVYGQTDDYVSFVLWAFHQYDHNFLIF